MKRNIRCFTIGLLILSVAPSQIFANAPAKAAPVAVELSEAEAAVLTHRLNEIKDMDISNMSIPEKKALRKEVKKYKVMGNGNGGVYISLGALIIIILLLILIF